MLAAVLIALRPVAPRISAVGSALAVLLFLGTISFLFSTPGIIQPGASFPALSMTGQFLIKDVALLGLSLFTLGDSLTATLRTMS